MDGNDGSRMETNGAPPRKVALFSGHMIDAPDRPKPRFPADKEPIAARAIAAALADLDIGPQDLSICGGACGGDLLFAEAALARSASLRASCRSCSTFFQCVRSRNSAQNFCSGSPSRPWPTRPKVTKIGMAPP